MYSVLIKNGLNDVTLLSVCKENEGTLSSNLPYIAYGSINGKMYLIRYLYDQPDISVIHGNMSLVKISKIYHLKTYPQGTSQSQLDSETEIRLISFVGVNKKRYLVVNHVNHSIITEGNGMKLLLKENLILYYSCNNSG